MSFTGPTIAELRAVYPPEKQRFDSGNLWGFLVMRKTSFYPTWLLVRLGFSANGVTILSLAVGIAGSVLLSTGKSSLDIAGAALVNLWNCLDYVDGNIARYKRTASSYGHFLDEAVGSLVFLLFGVGAGIGAYNGNSQIILPLLRDLGIPRLFLVVLTLLGVWAYTVRFLLRQTINQFGNIFPSPARSDEPSGAQRACRKISSIVDHAISLLPPLLLYNAIFVGMGTFITVYAFLFTLSAAIALTQVIALVQERLAGGIGRA